MDKKNYKTMNKFLKEAFLTFFCQPITYHIIIKRYKLKHNPNNQLLCNVTTGNQKKIAKITDKTTKVSIFVQLSSICVTDGNSQDN